MQAQGLKATITSNVRFFGSDQKIYVICNKNFAVGFLKIGKKKLFIRDEIGTIKEIFPMCVLDFYVHESTQRSGFGKTLFNKMLDDEDIQPHQLAYDRPSKKLMNFLDKYFGLKLYVPQNNNFVVFNDYFLDNKKKKSKTTKKDEEENVNRNHFIYKKPIVGKETNNHIYNCNDNDLDYLDEKMGKIKIDSYSNSKSNNSKEYKHEIGENKYNEDYDNDYDSKKKEMNINVSNKKKSIDFKNSSSPPWATSQLNSNFVSSSSSYGAYFNYTKNK